MIFTDSFEEINIEKGKEIGSFASSWCASPPYECPQGTRGAMIPKSQVVVFQ